LALQDSGNILLIFAEVIINRRSKLIARGSAMVAGLLLAAWGLPQDAKAFPPAPFFTVYGDVRDQYGVLLPAGGGSVVVYQGSKEILRQSLSAVSGEDHNYQMRMRMDMLRAATASYSSSAVTAGTVFTLGVDIGGVIYYPLEMSHPPTVGNPADRKRLNLTLGIDSDGDGLPDAWEESQLYQGGYLPGENGWDLSLIDRDGDLDKDGISNFNEYLAGTYASDATSTLGLQIKEKLADSVRLEFYGIYGKTYAIESSTDLKTWAAVPFSVAEETAVAQSSLIATTTGITSVYSTATAAGTFYRLSIR
jgi:hypothetical protein